MSQPLPANQRHLWYAVRLLGAVVAFSLSAAAYSQSFDDKVETGGQFFPEEPDDLVSFRVSTDTGLVTLGEEAVVISPNADLTLTAQALPTRQAQQTPEVQVAPGVTASTRTWDVARVTFRERTEAGLVLTTSSTGVGSCPPDIETASPSFCVGTLSFGGGALPVGRHTVLVEAQIQTQTRNRRITRGDFGQILRVTDVFTQGPWSEPVQIELDVYVVEPTIESIELTQAIQVGQTIAELVSELSTDLTPPVELVVGKPLAIRVYPSQITRARLVTVQVQVSFRPIDDDGNPGDLREIYSKSHQLYVSNACTPDNRRRREQVQSPRSGRQIECQSADFQILDNLVQQGTYFVDVWLENPDGLAFSNLGGGGTTDPRQSFIFGIEGERESIKAYAVSVCDFRDPATGAWRCGDTSDVNTSLNFLRKIAPVSDIDFERLRTRVAAVQAIPEMPAGTPMSANLDADSVDCFSATGVEVPFNDESAQRCEPEGWWRWITWYLDQRFEADGYGPNEILIGVTESNTPSAYGVCASDPRTKCITNADCPIPADGSLPVCRIGQVGGQASGIPSNSGIFLDSEAPDTLAHEIGHMAGLHHTKSSLPSPPCNQSVAEGQCTVGGSVCYLDSDCPSAGICQPLWPFSDNRLRFGDGMSSSVEVGFDVINLRPIDGRTAYDFMSYCYATNWISPFHYKELLRTDRPSIFNRQRSLFWRVTGAIIDDVFRLGSLISRDMVGPSGPGQGEYRIDVEDTSGSVLSSRRFSFNESAPKVRDGDGSGDLPPAFFFTDFVPVVPDAARIVIRDDSGAIFGSIVIEGQPPVVSVDPIDAGTPLSGEQTISWTVSDPDSDEHFFLVEYSANEGEDWLTLTASTLAESLLIDFDALAAADGSGRIRVTASDRVNSASGVSNGFSVSGKSPTAHILQPAPGSTATANQALLLNAVALDPDDEPGELDISWTSSVDGVLLGRATGYAADLTIAEHELTLTVVDTSGNSASDSVTVEIVDQPGPESEHLDDSDFDGFAQIDDCDDSDPDINPDAPETLGNGIDENCDGVDAIDPLLVNGDGDQYTIAQGDCDDSDAGIFPGAPEVFGNGVDEDCDGEDNSPPVDDIDGDGVIDVLDNCPDTPNPLQSDADADGIGDACDTVEPELVTVPDVVGSTEGAASTALADAGLMVGTVNTEPSESVPAGSVIRQQPPGGADVVPGSIVDLVVSSGPAPVPRACDIDGNGVVDRSDINLIFAARNEPASGPGDPRDYNSDGTITVSDGRACTRECDFSRCAQSP